MKIYALLLLGAAGEALARTILSRAEGNPPVRQCFRLRLPFHPPSSNNLLITAAKVDPLEPKFFQDLGAKRVKITYGPFAIPGSNDPLTMGMVTNHMFNITMPCRDCLITGWASDLQFLDGTSANANNKMWMHHTGLMNLNRTDQACEHWPERIAVNGNERSPFDFTLKGSVPPLPPSQPTPTNPLRATAPAKQATTSAPQTKSTKPSTS